MDQRQSDALSQLAAALQEMCDSGLGEDGEFVKAMANDESDRFADQTIEHFYQQVILLDEQLRQEMGTHMTVTAAVPHGTTQAELDEMEKSGQLQEFLWQNFVDHVGKALGAGELVFSSVSHYRTGEIRPAHNVRTPGNPELYSDKLGEAYDAGVGSDKQLHALLDVVADICDSDNRTQCQSGTIHQRLCGNGTWGSSATKRLTDELIKEAKSRKLIDYGHGYYTIKKLPEQQVIDEIIEILRGDPKHCWEAEDIHDILQGRHLNYRGLTSVTRSHLEKMSMDGILRYKDAATGWRLTDRWSKKEGQAPGAAG